MGADTRIEWADHTFNPWIGCTKVSPACDHCYAETLATARLGVQWGPHAERRRTAESTWRQPLAWNRKAERAGRRYRVFCASLADVFDNAVPTEWLVDLLDLIRITQHLDWLLLTKRPQLIRRRLQEAFDTLARGIDRGDLLAWIGAWLHGEPPAHVWLGTTVENQAEADRRIPHLLAVPAAKRFLSMEPLLGPVDLSGWLPGDDGCEECDDNHPASPRCRRDDIPRDQQCPRNRAVFITHEGPRDASGFPEWVGVDRVTLDWIITGGESGPRARPSHPDWFRSLRDQCQAAGVPFFFKQWGEWLPGEWGQPPLIEWQDGQNEDRHRVPCETTRDFDDGLDLVAEGEIHAVFKRVGKKAAGAMLDGREWRELPA
jgi:protein gp37